MARRKGKPEYELTIVMRLRCSNCDHIAEIETTGSELIDFYLNWSEGYYGAIDYESFTVFEEQKICKSCGTKHQSWAT